MRHFRPKIRLIALLLAVACCLAPVAPSSAAERIPDDPYFVRQWYLARIGAPEAWTRSLGFEGVTVAVIDSGVDIDHPDIAPNIWTNLKEIAGNGIDDDLNGYVDDLHGWDFVDEDNDIRPETVGAYDLLGVNHGTISAGIIAARGDNGSGITGVTWQSTIMPLRALGSGGRTSDPSAIVRAVEYAVKNGASIINLSFVGTVENDLLKIALKRAYDAGVLVVAAAGNATANGAADLGTDPRYPICLDSGDPENFILGVAATDEDDKKAAFSNYGSCVDVAAPGTKFLAAQNFDQSNVDFQQPYGGYYNGTSLSAPVVAGIAALVRAADRSLTPKRVIEIIRSTAASLGQTDPIFAKGLGAGRVDAAKAVSVAVAEPAKRPEPTQVAATTALVPNESQLIVVGAGPARQPEVRMFTPSGLFVRSFLAFPTSFRGGLSIAVGNFNGGLRHSMVVGALAGGTPQVRVFDQDGRAIGGFAAYDERFHGGVRVAVGDLDGDGHDEIVTGAGPGGGPHVRVFDANGRTAGGFFAFEPSFRGGISVAVGDLDRDGQDEIIVTPLGKRSAAVRVFDAKGRQKAEFFPYGVRDRSSIEVSVADADGDGGSEIVVVAKGEVSAWNGAGGRLGRISGDLFYRDRSGVPVGRKDSAFVIANGANVSAYAFPTGALTFQPFEPKYRGASSAAVLKLLR
jgi:hypothetical protein